MCVTGFMSTSVSQLPLFSKSHLYPSIPAPLPALPAPCKVTVNGAGPVAGGIVLCPQRGGLRFGVGVGVEQTQSILDEQKGLRQTLAGITCGHIMPGGHDGIGG